ncbi:MAG: TIM barrel protein [Chitinophagaceae bacterium]|nr:TIM barrel protein [Chitinophagaceae bacterium]MCZ2396763.1 TIM barrel protein [Chitinophagales bacterium]
MSINRRSFIKTAAAAGLAYSLSDTLKACGSAGEKQLGAFGLQLYTIRDVILTDTANVLKQVADMGYKQIESYEGDKGIFWGMTNTDFKKLMDDLGLSLVSSHTDISKDFEKKAAEAAAIGMKYLIDPWEGAQKSIDDFKRIADKMNNCGKICKQNGIRFAYHNHDYTFVNLDGQIPQDVLMKNTDPELVDFEMDIYWVVTSGHDPVKWINRYPGRFKLSHVKDRKKNVPLSEKEATCVLGTGEIDFRKIIKAGNFTYNIAEQEQYDNMSSLDAARLNAAYLKELRY